MDLDRSLVHALRQDAGLGWGAADFGESVSGDMMHFDCRNTVPYATVFRYSRRIHTFEWRFSSSEASFASRILRLKLRLGSLM